MQGVKVPMQVPLACCLTPEAAYNALSEAFQAALPEPLPAWPMLALTLSLLRGTPFETDAESTETRASGLKATAEARWCAYAAALPERTGCVLEWSDAQVRAHPSLSTDRV